MRSNPGCWEYLSEWKTAKSDQTLQRVGFLTKSITDNIITAGFSILLFFGFDLKKKRHCGAKNEVLLTDQPCSQTSRLQRRPSERSREHFLFVGLRHHFGTLTRHFSSNFLLALGPQVETWEIGLNFSIDFRPLDEWCELWRSDGFSPFIKSISCCLDDCCMSLGWSQYVSPNIWSDHNGRCWDGPAASPPNGIPTYCSMLGQTLIIGHRIMLECLNIIVSFGSFIRQQI